MMRSRSDMLWAESGVVVAKPLCLQRLSLGATNQFSLWRSPSRGELWQGPVGSMGLHDSSRKLTTCCDGLHLGCSAPSSCLLTPLQLGGGEKWKVEVKNLVG